MTGRAGRDTPDDQIMAAEDTTLSRHAPHFLTILRRALLAGTTGLALAPRRGSASGPSSLTFAEVPPGIGPSHAIAPGYDAQVLIRWGDPVLPGAPAFDPVRQSAAAQAAQFGTNADFLAFLPLPAGSTASDRGLLWANHEYPQSNMMFPGLTEKGSAMRVTQEQVDIEMAAVGGSVVEIKRDQGTWVVVFGRYNRRITATTPMRIAGPAAGHARMRTSYDPDGLRALGTTGNCAGGVTPWGTVLSGEENVDLNFLPPSTPPAEAKGGKWIGPRGAPRQGWGRFHDRFAMDKEPNEINRFGWVVEVDPYDPGSTPVKRTALGRFKHEGAETALAPDGRVVIYMGDDQRDEYLYRFVTRDRFDPNGGAANRDLLDHGTLSAARCQADGTLIWEALVFGQGPLIAENGFHSQAEVVLDARRAAELLHATPMDRPEDVQVNPVDGRVYAVLTNNATRKEANAANPRVENRCGHIVALTPPGPDGRRDHAADRFTWGIFLLAGNPDDPKHGARYGGSVTAAGWLACPDNIAFDNQGRLWIATDQGEAQHQFGIGDGIWACDTQGPGRALTRRFFRVPTGAEMCGPTFSSDCRSFFVAVQHPAGDDAGSSFDTPSTRWPDFRQDMPPRAAVVVITKKDGGVIGS